MIVPFAYVELRKPSYPFVGSGVKDCLLNLTCVAGGWLGDIADIRSAA